MNLTKLPDSFARKGSVSLCMMCLLGAVPPSLAADIPVIHDVDVVVVGGSGGAVAAAEAAAKSGARVFLAARRSYLGDDIAGTLHLWDDGAEHPQGKLSKRLFGERHNVLPYRYTIRDLEGRDTGEAVGHQLNNGIFCSADLYGVFLRGAGRVIDIDLGGVIALDAVQLHEFREPRLPSHALVGVTIETSTDGRTWTESGRYRNHPRQNPPEQSDAEGVWRYGFSMSGVQARHLRITSLANGAMARQTLQEIVVVPKNAGNRLTSVPRSELTPLNVKKVLDQALVDSGVLFMTGCYGTELLVDSQGRASGVVIANRSGRQAIKAKVVVDATPFGMLARQAGATFSPFTPGPVDVSTTVVTGAAPQAPGLKVRPVLHARTVTIGGRWGVKPADGSSDIVSVGGFDGKAVLNLADFSPFALSELEHQMRDRVFTYTQQDVAEMVRFAPPFRMRGQTQVKAWPAGGMPNPGAFRPLGVPGVYVLSGVADFSPEAARMLVVPANMMNAGEGVGQAAAEEAMRRPPLSGVRVQVAGRTGNPVYGEVRELLGGLMPNATTATGRVSEENAALPVLGECDVLVAGGGTSGSPAAITAARQGMDTVLCEYHHDLGGTATVGVLGQYYFGNNVGFTAEIEAPIGKCAANINQGKAEWFRRTARSHGVRILTGTLVCGVTVKDGKITGAVVATPDGRRGVILAKVVIDATGNADLAAAAGEPTDFINARELALQGASMNDRPLGSNTINVDIGFVDDTDAWDLSFFPLRTRGTLGFNSVWDQSQHVDSRERRRIVGVYTVTPIDVLNARTFEDTIVQGSAPFDKHGQTTAPVLSLYSPTERELKLYFPYRAILPRTIDGMLVVGLGMSADHDAVPAMRMQRDLQNVGYAAGLAASIAVKTERTPRSIDVRALQGMLVDAGILQPEALTWRDNFPLPTAELEAAVRLIPDRGGNKLAGYRGLPKLCTDPATAVKLLRDAMASASDPDARAMYAASLALFGDSTGVPVLIEALGRETDWDPGWQWSGPRAYDRKHSYLDGYILMLGHVKARDAVPAILAKADLLTETSAFSHFRAISLAFEQIGDRQAVPALSRLLDLPGVSGNSMAHPYRGAVVPYGAHSPGAGDVERRTVLREIGLARALYRLGDDQGKGEAVLRAYAADPRSAYARHAMLVLARPVMN